MIEMDQLPFESIVREKALSAWQESQGKTLTND